MAFPADTSHFPTRDEFADYLEEYAKRFALPVRGGARIERAARSGDGWVVDCGGRPIEAENVVVATGTFGRPHTPDFAAELDPGILQLHSSEYKRPSQLRDGPVLVDVANVIWCTGFKHEFGWIDPLTTGADGYPEEKRGVVPSAPGLFFAGLAFQYAFSSMLILGASRDAEHVVKRIVAGGT